MEHNDKLYDLLKNSKLELPFDDFESRMMQQIVDFEKTKVQMHQSKKMALLFFLIGTVFGMLLNYGLGLALDSYGLPQASLDKISFFSQLIYVILIVLFSDKL
ncbi:hypothetical protein [Sphingobacterium faecale]|uniref:Uncharacterized protein n=1 Tax=Sphingobacterium faecale TaxID=2803775 RepID=A0ABS1R3D0_9SPHI|nr:hypothetical protein [Sphingobacterium faecale]MBL1409202.1 hypothetical protein [Sphingobacterium faecale]